MQGPYAACESSERCDPGGEAEAEPDQRGGGWQGRSGDGTAGSTIQLSSVLHGPACVPHVAGRDVDVPTFERTSHVVHVDGEGCRSQGGLVGAGASHHRQPWRSFRQASDFERALVRQDLGPHLIDAEVPCHGLAGLTRLGGQQDRFDAGVEQGFALLRGRPRPRCLATRSALPSARPARRVERCAPGLAAPRCAPRHPRH